MKLIDADARVIVQSFDDEHEEYCHTEMSIADALDFFTDEGCPLAVDAAPVRHGRWETFKDELGFSHYQCSECGDEWRSDDKYRQEDSFFCYCPKCGAKMDGGEENDATDGADPAVQ